MKTKIKKEDGFTLIELLLVIGIIAVLAAAIIVAIAPGEQISEARSATEASQASSIATSMWACSLDGGTNEECGQFTNLDLPTPNHPDPEHDWLDTDISMDTGRPVIQSQYGDAYEF